MRSAITNGKVQLLIFIALISIIFTCLRHDKAAEHAKNGLIYAQEDLLKLKEIGGSDELIKEKVI